MQRVGDRRQAANSGRQHCHSTGLRQQAAESPVLHVHAKADRHLVPSLSHSAASTHENELPNKRHNSDIRARARTPDLRGTYQALYLSSDHQSIITGPHHSTIGRGKARMGSRRYEHRREGTATHQRPCSFATGNGLRSHAAGLGFTGGPTNSTSYSTDSRTMRDHLVRT